MRPSKSFIAILSFAFLLLPGYGIRLAAQTSGRPPLARLYWHFLDYQRFLDKSADDQEKKGKNGAELREKLQRKLGFSTYQFTIVRDAAQKLDRDLKKKDAQAMVIIAAFRKKYPPDQPLKGLLPPPPPELETLQQERDNLIEQAVVDLKAQLGPEATRKLDSFLQNEFAPSVTTHSVSAPASPQAAGQASQAVRP